jgi:hypothetical protein
MRIEPLNQQIQYVSTPVPRKASLSSCPHGNPAGSCPVCMGMSGGGGAVKHKPTPKELGLLTWADLMPSWLAMQAAKHRKEFNAIIEKLLQGVKILENSRLFQAINNFIDSKLMPKLQPALNFIDSKVISTVQKTFAKLTQLKDSFYNEIKSQILQQAAKTMALLNEQINLIQEKIKNSLQMLKSGFEMFISNMKEKEEAIKEFLNKIKKKLNKKLLYIIQQADPLLEDWDDEENNSERIWEIQGEIDYEHSPIDEF